MIRAFMIALGFAALASAAHASGKCFTPPGHVVDGPVDFSRHYDGDTFYINRDRIRLWGIDAPERDEYGYAEAAEHLRLLASRGVLNCAVKYHEKRGARRCVAVCSKFGAGFELGRAILAHGWAKIHRAYINEYPELKAQYEEAEALARKERRGVWQ